MALPENFKSNIKNLNINISYKPFLTILAQEVIIFRI